MNTTYHTATVLSNAFTSTVICEKEANSLFKKQETEKASGPDPASPASLKYCAGQLAPVFTGIFSQTQNLCIVLAASRLQPSYQFPKKQKFKA